MKSSNDNVVTSEFRFKDDGATPNNPDFALLLHKGAVLDDAAGDTAVAIEATFAANGWGRFWRNGVHPFHHYHTTCHEALGVARGWAEVRFGGEDGTTVRLEAGDVAVLPAGTGHRREEASPDFLVVGAYPPDQPYDTARSGEATQDEFREAVERIALTPIPATDPVFGQEGGLRALWRTPDPKTG